ncbi:MULTISPECIES: YhfG family protein [Pseudomonas]|nr:MULTISPECIES: YhfG family protein [Pseudomonas]
MTPTDIRDSSMDKLSLHAKKAWFAKHRTANFENSLRLEGFIVPPDDGKAKLPARAAAREAVRQLKA